MNYISRLATLTVTVIVFGSAWAAPKQTIKRYSKSPSKNAKKVTRKAPAPKKTAARLAPPSKATRPTDKYSSLAHQRAVGLVKQSAEAFARGDYNRAITLSKAASDAYPTYARAQTWMGASYHKLRRYDEAIKAYKWAIALAPGTVDAERAERGLREIGY